MTPHAPKLDVVARTVDQLPPERLDDTEAVIEFVIGQLGHRLYSAISRDYTRAFTIVVLQRRDMERGDDPARRLMREGDAALIEAALANADEYRHDEWDTDWPDGRR